MVHLLLPLADVSNAFNGLTTLIIGYLASVLAFVLAIAGYGYMFALDDHQRAANAKRAIGFAIGGSILVALAFIISTNVVTAIGK